MRLASEAVPEPIPIRNDQVVCTLFEGDYHLGVAVLINSIVRGGYRGLFWVGYRGELPPWLDQLAQLDPREGGLWQVGEALLGFEKLDESCHFTHFKPDFMTSILDRGIATNSIWYFDPDITVRCPWEFYERWVKHGVCLCQEITMGTMPSNHPIRLEWAELALKAGWGEPTHPQERYYNGGFVGLSREHKDFLKLWTAANRLASSAGVDHGQFQTGSRANTFQYADQDALNITTMYTAEPLSTVGPEGMGFVDGGFTMYHTVGRLKPWRKNFLRSALAGIPPWNGDKHFLECAEGPIQAFSAGRLKRLRRSARWATLAGRFFSRS
jgi:hypothetical protein